MRANKNRDNNNSTLVGVGLGILIGIAILFLGVAALTWLISKEIILETAVDYGILLITLLSSMIGSGVAVLYVDRCILPVSVGTSFSIFLFLIGLTALFFDGQFRGVWRTALIVIGSGLSVALIAMNRKNTRRSHNRKKVNR